jgi:GTP diphosphokinase / guanosine-3',5'-bis(diphosphate) 3'-diphosphatase
MKDNIKEAEQFARKIHKGQKQVTGKPYVDHPIKVASLLKSWKQDDEIIIAGLLHDVVEDCDVSLKEIEKKFGKRVAYLVDGMSWIRNKKSRKKEWDATYKKFAKYSKKEPVLVLIKAADMLSNIPNMHVEKHREWVINKSYPRNMTFYIPFLKSVGLVDEANKIVSEFHKYTRGEVKSVLYDYISKEELGKIMERLDRNP